MKAQSPSEMVSRLYRSESSKLLAVLTRLFGTQSLDLAEDVLQETFQRALKTWEADGLPPEPAAWLYRSAKNRAIDHVRAHRTRAKFAPDIAHYLESEWTLTETVEREFESSAIADDQLHMIFLCCRPDIEPKYRLPLILRTLCGFSVPAIARALMISEANAKKRLARTREQIKGSAFELPSGEELLAAMDSVHTALYLLFNEGYYRTDDKAAMRIEFCKDAMGLVALLVDAPKLVNQDTLGLFALMHFHRARARGRTDEKGRPIPLNHQDRSTWNTSDIATGEGWLEMTQHVVPGASGRYALEARIALEHCKASSWKSTSWSNIVGHYEQLVALTDSPVAKLNLAIAQGYAGEPRAGIEALEELNALPVFRSSHLVLAALAHLSAMMGEADAARSYALQAEERGGTKHEIELMHEQVTALLGKG